MGFNILCALLITIMKILIQCCETRQAQEQIYYLPEAVDALADADADDGGGGGPRGAPRPRPRPRNSISRYLRLAVLLGMGRLSNARQRQRLE